MSETPANLPENDYKLAKLFVMTIRQFFESTTLHGFKYLVQSGRSPFEKWAFLHLKQEELKIIFIFFRLLWYFIQICALVATVYIFLKAFDDFAAKPTFTSLESMNHPVWEVSFPAVAVCSVNKISKKAAMQYAIEL